MTLQQYDEGAPGIGPLQPVESEVLAKLERIIDAELPSFIRVGDALMQIRNRRLFRETHQSFDAYCRDRWAFGGQRAYQLIGAADIAQSLDRELRQLVDPKALPMVPLPNNAAVASELRGFSAEVQSAIWLDVIQRRPEGSEITASFVREVADGYREALYKPAGYTNYNVHFSSDSDDWHTPDWIIELVVKVLNYIELDPCSDEGHTVPALRHFTREHNGLDQEWQAKTVFMNPPYGREIELWVLKLVESYNDGLIEGAIALLPSRTDREWFSALDGYSRCFLRGRLRFSNYSNSAPFPSVVVYLGKQHDKFASVFSPFGSVWEARRNQPSRQRGTEADAATDEIQREVVRSLVHLRQLIDRNPRDILGACDVKTLQRLIFTIMDGRAWFTRMEKALAESKG